MTHTQILLANRPQGMVKDSDFDMVSSEIPTLENGQVLIQIQYISLDPAIRGWMNAGTTYMPGVAIESVMRAFSAGKIIESNNKNFPVGTFVEGLLGATTHAISNGIGLKILDLSRGNIPQQLGVLGMPGMTAYFGLLERGQPKAGETVFISGAAGVVGSTVGQIAKIKGCKVIGTASGKEKCDYLRLIGFDVAIDYKSQNVDEVLKKHCPEGISIYFDNVGGEILDIALANLAKGARVVICGAMSQYNNHTEVKGPKNYMKIVTASGQMNGIIVFDFIERFPEAVEQISRWIAEGKIHSKEQIIDGIENFAMGLRMLFEGKNFGKLLIKI